MLFASDDGEPRKIIVLRLTPTMEAIAPTSCFRAAVDGIGIAADEDCRWRDGGRQACS